MKNHDAGTSLANRIRAVRFKVYDYPMFEKGRLLVLVLLYVALPGSIYTAIRNFPLQGKPVAASGETMEELGLWLISVVIFVGIAVLVPHLLLNYYKAIRVKPEGLLVRFFWFIYRWQLISWEEIVDIDVAPIPVRSNLAFAGPVWIIRVERLSWWQRLINDSWSTGVASDIALPVGMRDRQELVELIQDYLKG